MIEMNGVWAPTLTGIVVGEIALQYPLQDW